MNYNIVPLDIKNGLKNHAIASGFNYLILLDAPSNANVTVRFNDNTADAIPLDKNSSIEINEVVRNIFISCDAVANGQILIGQAKSNEIKINSTSDIQRINEISDFGNVAKSVLQFIPTDSIKIPIADGSSHDFKDSNLNAIKFFNDGDLEIEINSNGVKLPIKANEEYLIFCQNLDNDIKIHNSSGGAVNLKALVMGNLTINLNYVEDGYVVDNYVL